MATNVVRIRLMPIQMQLRYLLGSGAMCLVLASVGLYLWEKTPLNTDTQPSLERSYGYTGSGVVGIILLASCATLAVVVLYESSQLFVRYAYLPHHSHANALQLLKWAISLQVLLGALFVTLSSVLLFTWGSDTMRCGIIFCLGVPNYPNFAPTRGASFNFLIAFMFFFSLIPMTGVMWYRLYTMWVLHTAVETIRQAPGHTSLPPCRGWTGYGDNDAVTLLDGSTPPLTSLPFTAPQPLLQCPTTANPMAKPASMQPYHDVACRKKLFGILVVCVCILYCGILTFWLPNDPRRFHPANIARYANLSIRQDISTQNEVVPEMPDAWFRTGQIRVSDDLTLKLFPGNIFFYTYLLATAVIVFVLRLTQTGRYWVQRRIPLCACFTYGEAAFVAATTVLAVMFFIYWLHDHNYKNAWSVAAKPTEHIEPAERWGRGLGQLAILFLSLLLLPVGRQSVVVSVLGVSRDGLLWFHRAVGYAMLAATVGHIVAFYVSFYQHGLLLHNLLYLPITVGQSNVVNDFTILVATWTTWFLLIAMGIFALNTVRRRYYELFYYTHLAATYMTLPVMVFHASAGWMYLLPGITVFLADQLVRLWQRSAVVRVVHARVIGEDTTELAFSVPGRWDMRRVHPGQYVLVCVPELTALQWHPFTLTNVVDKESVAVEGSKVSATGTVFYVHVKSMGPRTWTGRLYDLVRTGQVFSMAVEGPCGTPVDYSHYDNIVLVAGGIGATPCISIFGSLLRQHEAAGSSRACPRVDFIWSTRSAHHVKAVADMLQLPVRCGNAGCTPSPRGVLIEKGDASPPPEDRVDNAKPNTEAAESGAILWDAGQLNGDVKAVSRAVHTPSDCEQYFSFDVFLTREGGLGHVFTGNDRIDGRTSPEPGKTSALKPYAELNEELQMDVVATGTPDCASHRAYPLGPASGAAKRAERRGKAGAAGGRSPSESVGNVIEDSEFSCADGSDERFEDVPVRTVVDDEPGETLDSASTVAEEDVSVSNGVAQWLPSSSGTWSRCSQREDDGSGRLALRMHAGRPDVVALIREALRKPGSRAKDSAKLNKTRTLLFVCGPSTLVCQVLSYGAQLGVTVHQEEFLF